MKRLNIKISSRLAVILYSIALFLGFWLIWYCRYPYLLRRMEGYSFFSSFEDFVFGATVMPDDSLKLMGAFLLQFFYYPVVGAIIQALSPVIIFLAGAVVVSRLFKQSKGVLWLALIPVACFANYQFHDWQLDVSLVWVFCSVAVAIIVWIVTLKKHQSWALPSFCRNVYVALTASILLMGCMVYRLGYKDNVYQDEYYSHLEYLATEKQWGELLALVPPEKSCVDEVARRFAFLALLETDNFSKYALVYGFRSPEDYSFGDIEFPLFEHYNALLYRSLGMPNEEIRFCYHHQTLLGFGTNFYMLRELYEAYLKMKNYPMAKKYLDILERSVVMRGWVAEQRPKLEAIRKVKPLFEQRGAQFYTQELMKTMGAMSDRYPLESKYADVMLCSFLIARNADAFMSSFHVIAPRLYKNGKEIPAYYQQALMVIAENEPEVLQLYHINPQIKEAYSQVKQWLVSNQVDMVKRTYPNSFWAYCF